MKNINFDKINYIEESEVQKSDFEELNIENIDVLKEKTKRLNYEISLILTSTLINANMNLSKINLKDTFLEHNDLYTEEEFSEILEEEIKAGLMKVLDYST